MTCRGDFAYAMPQSTRLTHTQPCAVASTLPLTSLSLSSVFLSPPLSLPLPPLSPPLSLCVSALVSSLDTDVHVTMGSYLPTTTTTASRGARVSRRCVLRRRRLHHEPLRLHVGEERAGRPQMEYKCDHSRRDHPQREL
jgi:hypothetical protein